MNREKCHKCPKCRLCIKICKCSSSSNQCNQCSSSNNNCSTQDNFLKITINYCGVSVTCFNQELANSWCARDGYILETGDFKKGCCKLWKCDKGTLSWVFPPESSFYFYDQSAKRIFKSEDATCSELLGGSGSKLIDIATGNFYEYCNKRWEITGKFGDNKLARINVPCTLRWVELESTVTPNYPGKIVNTTPTTTNGEWFMTLEKSGNVVNASVFPTISEQTGGAANYFMNPGPTGSILFISPTNQDLSEFFPEGMNQTYTFCVVGGKVDMFAEKFQRAVVATKDLQDFNEHSDVIGNNYGGFYIFNSVFSTMTGEFIKSPFDLNQYYYLNPFSYAWTLYPDFSPGFMANFTATPTDGAEPLTVTFTDLSTTEKGVINSWEWNFGDGSTGSILQNPTHIYEAVGQYTVTLTVTNTLNETNSRTIPNLITVNKGLTADFTAIPNTGKIGVQIQFRNTSKEGNSPIKTYVWDFGDGSTPSAVKEPTHIYSVSGFYTVTLEITDNDDNVDKTVKENFIIIYKETDQTFDIFYVPEFNNDKFPLDFALSWFDGTEVGTSLYSPSSVIQTNVIRSSTQPLLQTNKNGALPYATGALTNSNVYKWTFPKVQNPYDEFALNETIYAFGFRLSSRSTGEEYTQNVYLDTLDTDLDSVTVQRVISRDIGTSDLDGNWEMTRLFSDALIPTGPEVIFLTADNKTISGYNSSGTYDVNTDTFGITLMETDITTSISGKLLNETEAAGTFTMIYTGMLNSIKQGTYTMKKFLPTGTMSLTAGSFNSISLAGVASVGAVGRRVYSDPAKTVLAKVSAAIYFKDLFYEMSFGTTGLTEGIFQIGVSPLKVQLTAQSQINPPDTASAEVIAGQVTILQFDENLFMATFTDLIIDIDPMDPVEFQPISGQFSVNYDVNSYL